MSDLIERLKNGVVSTGELHADNETEMFHVDEANETMAEAAERIAALEAQLAERVSSDRVTHMNALIDEARVLLDNCHVVEDIDIAAQHEAVMEIVNQIARIAALEAQLAGKVALKDALSVVYDCENEWRAKGWEDEATAACDIAVALSALEATPPAPKVTEEMFKCAYDGAVSSGACQDTAPGDLERIVRAALSAAQEAAPKVTEALAEAAARIVAKWLGYSWDGLQEGRIVEKGFPVFTHGQFGWSFQGKKGDLIDLAIAILTAEQEAGKP